MVVDTANSSTIEIPVPIMIAKGRSDSELSARDFGRWTFGVDPSKFDWVREARPEFVGKDPPPGYGAGQVKAEHAASWVGRRRVN